MDLENYWQENRRFVLSVAGGALLFLIAWWAIDAYLGSDVRRLEARKARLTGDLAKPMFKPDDLDRAREQNEALRAAVAKLREAASFRARERFTVPDQSAASSRYVSVVADVRADLLQRAGRAGLALPRDLGLPTLAPTREQEIVRTLEALDAIERTVGLAIEAGAENLDEVRIKLDPRLLAGKPISDLETTIVSMRLSGPSGPLVELLSLLQTPRDGSVLHVRRAELSPARVRLDEVKLDLELAIAHPHGLGAVADEAERG